MGPGRQRLRGKGRRGDGCYQAIRLGWAGSGCWAGAADARGWAGLGRREGEERAGHGKERPYGPKVRERKNDSFLFLFLQFSKSIFKFKFQFSLKSLINTKHSQNDMHQHVCIKKFLTLFLNFNNTKFIISLSLMHTPLRK